MYSVYTRLGNGELLFVAAHERLDEAQRLLRGLSTSWPHEYLIRDSKGNDIEPKNQSAALATQTEPGSSRAVSG
jgi:hypothetical protein